MLSIKPYKEKKETNKQKNLNHQKDSIIYWTFFRSMPQAVFFFFFFATVIFSIINGMFSISCFPQLIWGIYLEKVILHSHIYIFEEVDWLYLLDN